MDRKNFLKSFALIPLAGFAMKINQLEKLTGSMENTERMPVFFIGHGSPMNAIELNEFSRHWQLIGKTLPRPKAILCVSAHWETKGTLVTAMEKPRTIHDFGGFPQALFDVQYPAPGSPSLAGNARDLISSTRVGLDNSWGLDHGTWSILKHIYPEADVPVIQMSLDYSLSPRDHYELGRQLSSLRNKGILIMGSGNMVHNLRAVDWNHPDNGYDWAIEANETFKKLITENKHQELIQFRNLGKSVDLSIPTAEHFLPLLYMLALQEKDENASFFNDKTVMGSLSMTSVKIGRE